MEAEELEIFKMWHNDLRLILDYTNFALGPSQYEHYSPMRERGFTDEMIAAAFNVSVESINEIIVDLERGEAMMETSRRQAREWITKNGPSQILCDIVEED